MKTRLPVRTLSKIHWALAALLSTNAVWAQSLPAPQTAPQRMEQRQERAGAHHEQRLLALKSKLQLQPEQEGAWNAFATAMAVRPAVDRARTQDLAPLSTPERIDRMKALRQERQAAMGALADQRGEATKAFYAQLKAEQKKVFDEETARHLAHRGERGMRHHRG